MSVQFDGTRMMFDFIQLDLFDSTLNDPEFLSRIDYGVFEATDASAIGLLPVDLLNGLFWYRMYDRDLSDNNEAAFAVWPDNWPALRFSDARVTPETVVSKPDVTISEDFVRSIIRDIMGAVGFNCLFSNLEQMRDEVVRMDGLFDSLLRDKMQQVGGTFMSPKYLNENSPAGQLWNAFIHQDANDERRANFMEQILQKKMVYEQSYDGFYLHANDGLHGEGYYYPLYLSPQVGGERIVLNGTEFYIVGTKKGVPFVETPGLVDYREYLKAYFPIEFLKDDIIKIRLTYHHSETQIYNKTIHPRSYMVYIKLEGH
jgi:hypothetical protein